MSDNDLILYTSDDGQTRLVLREISGQVWLSQLEIAELYQTTKQNISKHVKAVISENELPEEAVVNSKFTTAADGKEYLTQLNRIVTMWLDYAEDQASRKKQVFLKDWISKLDDFLSFNERDVLQNAGRLSKKDADKKAQSEFYKYSTQQRQLKEEKGADSLAELLKVRDMVTRSKGE